MSILSSLGVVKKEDIKNKKYKYDFLSYHKKEVDWFALITILFFVNVLLILIDKVFIQKHLGLSEHQSEHKDLHPLFHVQVILCINHFLFILFARHFLDKNNHVSIIDL